MPLGGIFRRSQGERSRGHSRNLSSPVFMSDDQPPSTPRARARTLLSGPRTPLSKIFTSFGGRGGESWGKDFARSRDVESNGRPSTASSAYSSSSDSSFESMLTTVTDCTTPDSDDGDSDFGEDEPKLGPSFCESFEEGPSLTSIAHGSHISQKRKYEEREGIGARDIEWTDEMDGHLWRTYMLYQNDPTVTPFYVIPGGVPPLGVCLRVARVAKNSWKGSKTTGGLPRNARARTPVKGERLVVGNKADLMRKSSVLRWPHSESTTRKRLRILCRRGYGPSNNPYHNHRQDPTQFRAHSRLATDHLLIPLPPIADDFEDGDRSADDALLTSTRSIALNLATSTSVPMSGAVPTPQRSEPESTDALHNYDPLPEFRGFTDANGNAPPVAVILARVGLGHPVPPRNAPPNTSTPLFARRARANTTTSASIEPPFVLSPLQLGSEFGDTLSRPNDAPVRQTAEDLIDDGAIGEPKTPPRTRPRGYTVNVGASNGRRRARPSPLSTPLPAWAYEIPEGVSDRPNLAQLLEIQSFSAGVPRLGLPFVEDNNNKGKWRASSDDELFGPPLPKKLLSGVVAGGDSRKGAHESDDEVESRRPIKRMRE